MNNHRIAIVTGASGAIGAAICEALASEGYGILGVYRRDAASARSLRERLQPLVPVSMLQADLGDPSVAAAIVTHAREIGVPQVLVNNAGLMTKYPVTELSDADWGRSLEVNLSAPFRLCRAAIPHFVETGSGRIINISSQAAFRGSVGRAHYAAAKAGLLGLTYSLARELGEFDITVNAVVPGRITSEMLLSHEAGQMDSWLGETPLHRLGTPQEVASAVAYLASSGASYITGVALQVGGGLVMG
ncbi:MAG: SDR family oxidoreductase [Propionibacteriaceae bacterium]|nr:SDR family oxidoreductase [Propionibacteriaceae bacterium]